MADGAAPRAALATVRRAGTALVSTAAFRIPATTSVLARHVLALPVPSLRLGLSNVSAPPAPTALDEPPLVANAEPADALPAPATSGSTAAGAGGHSGTTFAAYLAMLLLLCSFLLRTKGRQPRFRRPPSLTYAPLVPPG